MSKVSTIDNLLIDLFKWFQQMLINIFANFLNTLNSYNSLFKSDRWIYALNYVCDAIPTFQMDADNVTAVLQVLTVYLKVIIEKLQSNIQNDFTKCICEACSIC